MEYMIQKKNDELMHYGVIGMKWGVRKATKNLVGAKNKKDREKAIASLNEHKAKSTSKIKRLEKKHYSLEKKVNQRTAREQKLLYKADKLYARADKLQARADAIRSKSDKARARIAKNEKMTLLFEQGIDSIDQTIINYGEQYLNS